MVIFHHGLGGGRAQMLLVADRLAASGFVVAAIDAPLHGDRSYCTQAADCVLDPSGTGTCTPVAPPGTPQGDEDPDGPGPAGPPGTCTAGALVRSPVLCATAQCFADFAAAVPSQRGGVADTSASYFVSGNLYRLRDSIRQDLVDVSSLALALARPPPAFLPALPGPQPVVEHLLGRGLFVNPGAVYYEGQSLGALLGTLNVAANQRLSRGVLNVGGATATDIVTQSPAFAPMVADLLASLGIAPGSPEYLLFIQTAKWILDPADPVNFAGLARARVAGGGLAILGQWAACDQVVPNTATALLHDNLGLGAASPTASTSVLYANSTRAGAACALGVAPNPGTLGHSFLADWGLGSGAFDPNDLALTLFGQDDAATFLLDLTLPPPVRAIP
jgi:hypothetical protein